MGFDGRMELDRQEILRYMGVGRAVPPEEVLRLTEETAQLVEREIRPRTTYRVLDLERGEKGLFIPDAGLLLEGRTAGLMLEECNRCILLAATLGAEFDALLRTWQVKDMARAVVLDACGSAGVEWACDQAEEALHARLPGTYLTDRFSPGYGDLSLNVQPALCAALDAQRRIGLHVTDRCLLNPGKSVTAVVGLAATPQRRRIRGCAYCSMAATCTLRKRGQSCAP